MLIQMVKTTNLVKKAICVFDKVTHCVRHSIGHSVSAGPQNIVVSFHMCVDLNTIEIISFNKEICGFRPDVGQTYLTDTFPRTFRCLDCSLSCK